MAELMNAEVTYRFFRITDILIPVFIVIVLVAAGNGGSGDAENLQVEVHCGEAILVRSLDADTSFSVDGNLGPVTVRIGPQGARIAASPCPGQDCVRRGWLSREGDLSICVPSGVFLVITDSEDPEASPDAVSY
jgi:hypothetical protein